MAIVAEMEQEAAAPEPLAPSTAPAAALDLEAIDRAVAQAIAAHLRSRRASWQTAVIGVLAAGLIALAGVAYSTLRADMTAMRTEIGAEIGSLRAEIGSLRAEMRSEIGGLRAEMREEFARVHEEFARVHMVLLDHTDRLARLEAIVGVPRADDG